MYVTAVCLPSGDGSTMCGLCFGTQPAAIELSARSTYALPPGSVFQLASPDAAGSYTYSVPPTMPFSVRCFAMAEPQPSRATSIDTAVDGGAGVGSGSASTASSTAGGGV